ncbi:MAG TPA: hypothetical protein VL101_17450 [Nordella sp.]|nr:hypothetical protein [Nordella sp.]
MKMKSDNGPGGATKVVPDAMARHRETDYLLRSPRNADRLLRAIAELEAEKSQAAVPPTVI